MRADWQAKTQCALWTRKKMGSECAISAQWYATSSLRVLLPLPAVVPFRSCLWRLLVGEPSASNGQKESERAHQGGELAGGGGRGS